MGKSNKIEETEYEKELAAVYKEQWDYYQDSVVPVENQVIEDAKASNDSSVYQNINDDTNLAYQRSFSGASKNSAENLSAKGVDPSSGKFKGTISSLADMEGTVSADAKSRSEVAGQERYIDKLSNVMAMGQGQAQESVATLSDIAVNSQRKAINDASISAQNKANTLSAVGAVGGAYASHSLNGSKSPAANNGGSDYNYVNATNNTSDNFDYTKGYEG